MKNVASIPSLLHCVFVSTTRKRCGMVSKDFGHTLQTLTRNLSIDVNRRG